MEKVNRALYGVEDNAEAIRALRARVDGNAKDVGVLNDKVEQNSNTVAELVKAKTKIIITTPTAAGTLGTYGRYSFTGPAVAIFGGNRTEREYAYNNTTIGTSTGVFVYSINSITAGEFKFRPFDKSVKLTLIGMVEKIA